MEEAETEGPHGVTGTSDPKGHPETFRRRDPSLRSEQKHHGPSGSRCLYREGERVTTERPPIPRPVCSRTRSEQLHG